MEKFKEFSTQIGIKILSNYIICKIVLKNYELFIFE